MLKMISYYMLGMLLAVHAAGDTASNPVLVRLQEAITFHAGFEGTVEPSVTSAETGILSLRGEPRYAEGLFGKGLLVGADGGGTQISFPYKGNLDFTRPGSLSFWMSPVEWKRGEGGYRRYISVHVPGRRYFMFIQRQSYTSDARAHDSLQFLFYYFPEMRNRIVSTSANRLRDGQWHFITLTWDEERYQVFLDGRSVGEAELDRPFRSEDFPQDRDVAINIGGGGADTSIIDEFTVYGRVLELEEIMDVFRMGTKVSYLLDETLNELPMAAVVAGQGPERITKVRGRRRNLGALQLEATNLIWSVQSQDACFVEFWNRPVAWDGASDSDVALASFRVGGDDFHLRLEGGKRELALMRNDKVLQTYPVYNWVEQDWMVAGDEAERWHYLTLVLENQNLCLYVDGFAAREGPVHLGRALPLQSVTLHGDRGSRFAELRVVRGSLTADNVRARYLHLYRGDDERLLRVPEAAE